jgi:hypothetical protein
MVRYRAKERLSALKGIALMAVIRQQGLNIAGLFKLIFQ